MENKTNKNINLLPGDLQRKKNQEKNKNDYQIEYTTPGASGKNRLSDSPEFTAADNYGPSFFGRIIAGLKSAFGKDASATGAPVPTFMQSAPKKDSGEIKNSFTAFVKADKKPALPPEKSATDFSQPKNEPPAPRNPEQSILTDAAAAGTEEQPKAAIFSINKIETQKSVASANQHEGDEDSLNLLSEEYANVFQRSQRKRTIVYSLSVAFLAIILIFSLVHLYELQKTKKVQELQIVNDKVLQSLELRRKINDENKNLLVKTKIVEDILANHISLQAFLEKLELATMPDIKYTDIVLSRAGTITLKVLAPNYTSMANQILAMEDTAPWIKEVIVTSARKTTNSKNTTISAVEFDMTLQVDKAVFQRSK